MKKIKLNLLELGASEVLTRSQLKHVLAGDDDATTAAAKKYCRTFCKANDDGEIFEWVHVGRECNTLADCGTVQCDTAYGPIQTQVTGCS